jgi:hypothetical protein
VNATCDLISRMRVTGNGAQISIVGGRRTYGAGGSPDRPRPHRRSPDELVAKPTLHMPQWHALVHQAFRIRCAAQTAACVPFSQTRRVYTFGYLHDRSLRAISIKWMMTLSGDRCTKRRKGRHPWWRDSPYTRRLDRTFDAVRAVRVEVRSGGARSPELRKLLTCSRRALSALSG